VDRVTLTIHLNEQSKKQVNLRRNVMVQAFIEEILGKFEFAKGDYSLFRMGQEEPLDSGRTLAQYGLKNGDELVIKKSPPALKSRILTTIETGDRVPMSGSYGAYLEEERHGLIFEIQWQPAIIGRIYQMNPSQNKLLAIDLSGVEGSEFVSRHHACISEKGGQFFIESLNPRNPTYINDQALDYLQEHILQPGDRVRVGKIVLTFNLRG
jgi:hypothetical protein